MIKIIKGTLDDNGLTQNDPDVYPGTLPGSSGRNAGKGEGGEARRKKGLGDVGWGSH